MARRHAAHASFCLSAALAVTFVEAASADCRAEFDGTFDLIQRAVFENRGWRSTSS